MSGSKNKARGIINYKIKTIKDYKNKTKKELLSGLHSHLLSYNILRNRYIDILLENEFLKRKLEITEKKVKILNNNGNHHSFKHMTCRSEGKRKTRKKNAIILRMGKKKKN